MNAVSTTAQTFTPLRIAVLTVSDTRTVETDRSGDVLAERIVHTGHTLAARAIVRDEIPLIELKLRQWVADKTIDIVLSTGGTGITGRDVTPEAFRLVLDKELPGFGELFRMKSYAKIGLAALQSRALGGVAGATFLFALPGSPAAVADAWDEILSQQFSMTQTCSLLTLLGRLAE